MAAHDQFCSTWGNYHYKTFDGGFFQLPYTCNYILTHKCQDFDDFNIQLQRQDIDGDIIIKRVMLTLEGVNVELTNSSITVNDAP